MKKILFLFILATCSLNAQVQTPQASPKGKIEQKVGLTDVTVEYSRPSMRGRSIFGDLVPFNKKWRTGANENTIITFSDDVVIDGKTLPQGKYAIYTVPGKEEWDVIFYKNTQNWGLPQEWNEADVALTATVKVMQMPMEMETFTIVIDELKPDSAVLNFLWENTITFFKFTVPTDQKTMESIETALGGPSSSDYYAAANYYYESEKDLNKALEWMNKAIEMQKNPPFYMLRRKSLLEAQMGKKKDAIVSAKKSLEAAKKAGNEDYVKMNEDSLKEWGAK